MPRGPYPIFLGTGPQPFPTDLTARPAEVCHDRFKLRTGAGIIDGGVRYRVTSFGSYG